MMVRRESAQVGREAGTRSCEAPRLTRAVGEDRPTLFDFPTRGQAKIYHDNDVLHLQLSRQEGTFEKVSRRPLIYELNALSLKRLAGWRWASDVFAGILMGSVCSDSPGFEASTGWLGEANGW